MKRILFIVFISLVAIMAQAADNTTSGERVLESLTNLPGVESTYIGPAALRLAYGVSKNIPGVPSGVKNITSVEVIESTDSESTDKIKNFVRKLIKQRKFEVLVENKEDDEENIIYGGMPDPGSSTLKNMLVVNSEPDDYVLVYIQGDINITELQNVK